jgi:hypothetical protein
MPTTPQFDPVERAALEYVVHLLTAGDDFVSEGELHDFFNQRGEGSRFVSVVAYFRNLGILEEYEHTQTLPDGSIRLNPKAYDERMVRGARYDYPQLVPLTGWKIAGKAVELWRFPAAHHPPSLTATEQKVLDIIKAQPKGKGVIGKFIIKELKRKKIDINETTLRRHILPKLILHFGVRNQRGAGGYLIP